MSQPEELFATDRCPSCLPVEDADELVRSLAELRALHAAVAMRVGGVEARGLELADVASELVVLRASIENVVHTFEPTLILGADAEARERYEVLDTTAKAAEGKLAGRRRSGLVLLGALALLFVALLGWDRTLRGAR